MFAGASYAEENDAMETYTPMHELPDVSFIHAPYIYAYQIKGMHYEEHR